MTYQFKNIGIIAKKNDDKVISTLNKLIHYLNQCNINVFLDNTINLALSEHQYQSLSIQEIGTQCDLVISVGGDGTLLGAARELADYEIPLLGINLGRLGFLVDISPVLLTEKMEEILTGQYMSEQRFLLEAKIIRDNQLIQSLTALNDVVIHKWNVARMIEIETFIDHRFLNRQHSDGLIVATPTGSTAYALSGGGPIVHPALDAILLVPVCPHTLSNRPIVVDNNCQIQILLSDQHPIQARMTCDGQTSIELVNNDQIVISKKSKKITLLHPSDHDYYEIIRAKLHWSEQPKN